MKRWGSLDQNFFSNKGGRFQNQYLDLEVLFEINIFQVPKLFFNLALPVGQNVNVFPRVVFLRDYGIMFVVLDLEIVLQAVQDRAGIDFSQERTHFVQQQLFILNRLLEALFYPQKVLPHYHNEGRVLFGNHCCVPLRLLKKSYSFIRKC